MKNTPNNKKTDYFNGNPAISLRPEAFRPCLSTGLAFHPFVLKAHK